MTYAIHEEEWWPVYVLEAPYRDEKPVAIPDELVARYEAARAEWEAVQDILGELAPPWTPGWNRLSDADIQYYKAIAEKELEPVEKSQPSE